MKAVLVLILVLVVLVIILYFVSKAFEKRPIKRNPGLLERESTLLLALQEAKELPPTDPSRDILILSLEEQLEVLRSKRGRGKS
jgi:hypothetical protein